ncbi:MAG: DnaJ domain-containing protein [Rhodospirillales bacterium]|nr:DnaJ domain-containing protein [Rhodospirillales bacterium]
MLPWFLLGFALLIGLGLIAQWLISAEPKEILKAMRWSAIILIGAFIVFLLVSGRLAWALMMLPAWLPWFFRFRQVARTAKAWRRAAQGRSGQATGQTSEIATAYFRMTLDHDSGEMRGDVLKGQHAGRHLEDMGEPEIRALLTECADDPESVRLLEAYYSRIYGGEEQTYENAGQGAGAGGGMSREEAYRILGLEPDASDAEVKAAYHRLMAKIHPDHGGSNYLAGKLNEAREALLGE